MQSESTITAIRSWAYRVARIAMLAMFATVPVHFVFHRWEVSDVIVGFAFALLLAVTLLSLLAFRFGLLAWAFLAMLLHSLSAFG